MKYSIYINQKALMEIAPKITIEEAAVLNFLTDICRSQDEKIQQQRIEGYTWVNYGHLLNEMPLLRGRTKITLTKKINNLEKYGFIKTEHGAVCGKKRKYVKITKICNYLYSKEGTDRNEEIYQSLKDFGMNDTKANVIASEKNFIEDKFAHSRLLKKIKRQNETDWEIEFAELSEVEKDIEMNKIIKDPASYVWCIYEQWSQGYL